MTNQECPPDAVCCDGSDESCDGTRLPSGDGTNSEEFLVGTEGLTVTDAVTGLIWQRDGSSARAGCTTDSTHLTCTWAEAKAYCRSLSLGGFSDWRLPAEHELHTIVDLSRHTPAIDASVFPNTRAAYHWTASPSADQSGNAWYIDFDYGSSWYDTVDSFRSVRCVRGSRCYPTSRFVVSHGLVSDSLTDLVWQQLASTTDMTWSAAQSYCAAAGSGFRLPTLKELESLVDFAVAYPGPTTDRTVFHDTPAHWFWTSSPDANSPGDAWFVSFTEGDVL